MDSIETIWRFWSGHEHLKMFRVVLRAMSGKNREYRLGPFFRNMPTDRQTNKQMKSENAYLPKFPNMGITLITEIMTMIKIKMILKLRFISWCWRLWLLEKNTCHFNTHPAISSSNMNKEKSFKVFLWRHRWRHSLNIDPISNGINVKAMSSNWHNLLRKLWFYSQI